MQKPGTICIVKRHRSDENHFFEIYRTIVIFLDLLLLFRHLRWFRRSSWTFGTLALFSRLRLRRKKLAQDRKTRFWIRIFAVLTTNKNLAIFGLCLVLPSLLDWRRHFSEIMLSCVRVGTILKIIFFPSGKNFQVWNCKFYFYSKIFVMCATPKYDIFFLFCV